MFVVLWFFDVGIILCIDFLLMRYNEAYDRLVCVVIGYIGCWCICIGCIIRKM